MLNDEDKQYMLNEYLRHISHMQDKEYQDRVWIKNKGPECQDFDDAVCDFFDMGEPILSSHKDFGITQTQYQILIKFRNEFDAFCRGPALKYYFPEQFIDTPEWVKIMEMAKEVLKAFNYKPKMDKFYTG